MTVSRAPLRPDVARPVPLPVSRIRPQSQPTKLLQRLQLLQHIAVASALLLTSCVFVVYGWTVHTQRRWNQQYDNLEHLKQMEGRLINATEALDHDRLQRAWDQESLVRETPERVILMEAAPPRPPLAPESRSKPPSPALPVAY